MSCGGCSTSSRTRCRRGMRARSGGGSPRSRTSGECLDRIEREIAVDRWLAALKRAAESPGRPARPACHDGRMTIVLDDAAVVARLRPAGAVEAMRAALVAAHRGELVAPPRVRAGSLMFTAGRLTGRWYG